MTSIETTETRNRNNHVLAAVLSPAERIAMLDNDVSPATKGLFLHTVWPNLVADQDPTCCAVVVSNLVRKAA